MSAICLYYSLKVCKLRLRCIIGIHIPPALKRRRNNPGLGCFRQEEHMSLVATQAEMLALTAGDPGPPAHVTVVIRSLSSERSRPGL